MDRRALRQEQGGKAAAQEASPWPSRCSGGHLMRPSEKRRRAANPFEFRTEKELSLYRGRTFEGRIVERASGVEASDQNRDSIGEFTTRNEALEAIAVANKRL